MLSGLLLENFKAFGGSTFIPLAPLTLIFGENSAGKSSITQALSLLKQTRESREVGAVLLPRADVDLVDLGSYQELVFDHEVDKNVAIGLRIRVRPSDTLFPRAGDLKEVMIRFEFGFASKKIEIRRVDLYLENFSEPFASFAPAAPDQSDYFFSPFPFRPRALTTRTPGLKLAHISSAPIHWQSSFDFLTQNRAAIVKGLRAKKEALEKPGGARRFAWMNYTRPKKAQADNKYWSNKLQQLLSIIPGIESLESWTKFMRSQFLEVPGTLVLDGFMPSGISSAPTWIGSFLSASTDLEPGALFNDSIQAVPEPTSLLMMAATLVERHIEQTFPLGPFRQAPERYYIYTGSNPSDVGYSGDLMPDLLFRNAKLLRNANKWLDRLSIGYKLGVRRLNKSNDLFELRLTDQRRSKALDASLSDVGFGISQLLPFLVQSLAKADQIITVEQPEVHIHPRLQADLGDLIADAASSELRNQFLIETHSEHLMLRMQRLIRTGRLPKKDVCVLFVSRAAEGARVQELRLNEEGEFIDSWPGGFFPERLRELM